MTFPPMPWRLVTRGATLVTLHLVPLERARAVVPPEFRILPVLPGYTAGGLFVTEYGPGSEMEYNELIAAGAMVWHEGRPCPWVTHLYVDSEQSVRGGRELLGVPKRFAPFTRDEERGEIVVGERGRPICRFRMGGAIWLWRQRLRIVSLHRDVRDHSGATVVAQGNEVEGRGGLTWAGVEIPAGSPLRALDLGRPLFSLCAREVEAVLGGAAFHPARTVTVGARGG